MMMKKWVIRLVVLNVLLYVLKLVLLSDTHTDVELRITTVIFLFSLVAIGLAPFGFAGNRINNYILFVMAVPMAAELYIMFKTLGGPVWYVLLWFTGFVLAIGPPALLGKQLWDFEQRQARGQTSDPLGIKGRLLK